MSDDHKSVTITLAQLRAAKACSDQRELFKERFGESVTFTSCDEFVNACVENYDFNYNWAAANLLASENSAEYERQCAPILAEYERQRATIRAEYERQHAAITAEYERQRATIRAEYERQCATIWAEYNRQRAPIWAEYTRQCATIWAEYNRQRAPIWARLYWAQAAS